MVVVLAHGAKPEGVATDLTYSHRLGQIKLDYWHLVGGTLVA